MNKKSRTNHVTESAADYVLDLLPPEEKKQVIEHIAICSGCRKAIEIEKQLPLLVKSTLNNSPGSSSRPGRMFAGEPKNSLFHHRRTLLRRHFALIGIAIVLLFTAVDLTMSKKFARSGDAVIATFTSTALFSEPSTPSYIVVTPETIPTLPKSMKPFVTDELRPLVTPAPSAMEAR